MDILLILAVAPAAYLLYRVYKLDPVEKEPLNLLGKLVLFGAISTIPVGLLEGLGFDLFTSDWRGGVVSYLVVQNFFIVAVLEEGFKLFFLRLGTWNNSAFDYVFDGIVYSVFVSLGFALLENIGYVYSFGFETGVLRAFTAVPGHAIFGVYMGYFYGLAKYASANGNNAQATTNMVLAFVVPVFMHGAYDFLASIDGEIALLAFFAFLIAIAFLASKMAKKMASEAKRLHPESAFTQTYYYG